MALVTIMVIVTVVFAFRRKEWLLALVAMVTGLMLAATGTKVGATIVEALTTLSKTVDSWFK
jgi:NADH:ubiquinone oxidoreductase subunit D